jgi:hypothetical protein
VAQPRASRGGGLGHHLVVALKECFELGVKMNSDREYPACCRCGANRGQVEVRNTIRCELTLSLVNAKSASDQIQDTKNVVMDDRELFCFACYIRLHGAKPLEVFGDHASDRRDVPVRAA